MFLFSIAFSDTLLSVSMLRISGSEVAESFRPPAPCPPEERLRLFKLLATLKQNPLECWSAEFFRKPIAKVRLPFTDAFLVHDPASIKRVLVDNADNYRKDPIQRRILATGLADGLLSVEGKRWEVQRRTLAPLFARRTVAAFADAMLTAADTLAGRWRRLGPQTTVDVAAEMRLITLNVLSLTIFSDWHPGRLRRIPYRYGCLFCRDWSLRRTRSARGAEICAAAGSQAFAPHHGLFRRRHRRDHRDAAPASCLVARPRRSGRSSDAPFVRARSVNRAIDEPCRGAVEYSHLPIGGT